MSEAFTEGWLALRERFDAAARSEALAAGLAAALPPHPRILDLGAGTGSLFRWLAPRLGPAQDWLLVDTDAGLLASALATTARWAEARGMHCQQRGDALTLDGAGARWRLRVRQADLGPGLPDEAADAVVTSALLDLVSAPWLGRTAARLSVPLLATLSVDGGDAIRPRHRCDVLVRAAFRRDQHRDKGFGRALGPHAPALLARLLTAHGFAVATAAADWRVAPAEAAMLTALVAGHAEAARRQRPTRQAAIARWEAARRQQIGAGRLAIRIGHRDILALPPRSAHG